MIKIKESDPIKYEKHLALSIPRNLFKSKSQNFFFVWEEYYKIGYIWKNMQLSIYPRKKDIGWEYKHKI